MATQVPAPTGPVLSGVDDAPDQRVIARYAAAEAARTGRELRLVHAVENAEDSQAATAGASAVLEPFVTAVEEEFPGLDVHAEPVAGRPAATLIQRSAQASVLVLGHRGSGGFPRLPLGSVSWQVATHAACPVIVLRPGESTGEARDRVVLGAERPDLSFDLSSQALSFAVAAAQRRGARLEIVHAVDRPQIMSTGPAGPAQATHQDTFPEEERSLKESAAGYRGGDPPLEVTVEVRRGHAASVLAKASVGAALVVVGSHGRAGLRRMMLGSVSAEVLHTASSPVAVLPPARE